MRIPRIRLSSWLIVCGWVLVIGGVIEFADFLLHRHWVHPLWRESSFLYALLHGPATHIGLGSILWVLARR